LPDAITYNHVTARDLYHELPPFAGGILPVINALSANPPSLFENGGLAEALLQSVIERVVPATSSFHS
jgi:hypothetical protein